MDWPALEGDAGTEFDRDCLKWPRCSERSGGPSGRRQDRRGPLRGHRAGPIRRSCTTEALEVWGKYELREKVGEGSFGGSIVPGSHLESELATEILHQRTTDTRLRADLQPRPGVVRSGVRASRVLGIESNGDRVGLCMDFVKANRSTTSSARTNHERWKPSSWAVTLRSARRGPPGGLCVHKDVKRGTPSAPSQPSARWTSAPGAMSRKNAPAAET